MRPFLLFPVVMLFLLSCNDTKVESANVEVVETTKHINWTPPAPGELVAEFKEKIQDDPLNDTYFEVSILSTDISKEGMYELVLGYGKNINTTTLEMPKWKEGIVLKPAIQKGEKKLQCYIGFIAEDSLFHEFYKVSAEDKNIRLKQTKAYSLTK